VIEIFKNEEGAVLILSIIIISVLAILATTLAGSINNNISLTKKYENDVRSFYMAEAGIERGIDLLKNNSESVKDLLNDNDKYFSVNELNQDLSLNNFDLFILKSETEDYDYKIKSEANINNSFKEIIISLNLSSLSGLFDYLIASNGNLNVNAGNLTLSAIDDPKGGKVISTKINHPDNFLNPDGTVKSSDNIKEIDKNDDYITKELEIIKDFFSNAQTKAEVINWSDYQNDFSNVINGETVVDLEDKIVYVNNNMTLNKDVLIKGNGVLIVDGNLNANQKQFNVNYSNNSYLDSYSLVYFSQNANPQVNNFKGLLMTDNNINTNSGDYEIIGSLFTDHNSNLNHGGKFVHDNGYIEVFNQIADKYDIDLNEIFANSSGGSNGSTVSIMSWEES